MEEEGNLVSLMNLVEDLWKLLADKKQPVTHPDYWTKLLDNAKLYMEDRNLNQSSDFEKLETALSKIIKAWKMNWKRWLVDTFEQLYAKTSRLLGATYQMFFSLELQKILEDCVDGWIAADPHTEEDFSSLPTKETTSMSSTTAHGATTHAGASGTKKR